jgi:hypothetical protein
MELDLLHKQIGDFTEATVLFAMSTSPLWWGLVFSFNFLNALQQGDGYEK